MSFVQLPEKLTPEAPDCRPDLVRVEREALSSASTKAILTGATCQLFRGTCLAKLREHKKAQARGQQA
jgi:hypothetical protein